MNQAIRSRFSKLPYLDRRHFRRGTPQSDQQEARKIDKLLDFAIASAERRAGSSDTLLFPAAFGHYLKDHVFASLDPETNIGKKVGRHPVGHGAAAPESYTMARALQALLTLDQLAFYTD